MKYIKNFEEIEIDNEWNNMFKFTDKDTDFTYKFGDYVLLDLDEIKKTIIDGNFNEVSPPIVNMARIYSVFNCNFPYAIKTYDNDDLDIAIADNEIIRKLTPKEIKKYKKLQQLYKSSKKYNI
jgi:hypothetical protein